MPRRKTHQSETDSAAPGQGRQTLKRVVYIGAGECMKGLESYPRFVASGLACGCRACHPEGWCAGVDGEGGTCPHMRCFIAEAALYPYCWEHYRRVVLQRAPLSVGEILHNVAGAGVGKRA